MPFGLRPSRHSHPPHFRRPRTFQAERQTEKGPPRNLERGRSRFSEKPVTFARFFQQKHPANAGDTNSEIRRTFIEAKKHSRMRGEKHLLLMKVMPMQETPPHARGKVSINDLREAFQRTPPHARGKAALGIY